MVEEVHLSFQEAEDLAMRACLASGAASSSARSLVNATLSAARHGRATLGFPHLLDYLTGFIDRRIKCNPTPRLERSFPAFLVCDADGGIAQLGFHLALNDLVDITRTYGVAVFTQHNSFTTGELGYYVRTLADEGIIALAATNAHAMVATKPGDRAVYSTNPLAFGFPLGSKSPPVVIDQASSATAFVNILHAAEEDQPIPEGWAVDANGQPTTDPTMALRGTLLPFGGRKGGNVALLVEMLSAGLSGGNWSLDVPDFRSGPTSPGVGLTIIAIMPGKNGDEQIDRAKAQSQRLQEYGVHVPGVTGYEQRAAIEAISIPRSVFDRVSAIAFM